ncbi:hypothetical protein L484_006663 [Morus notabilis]|uniref:Uncharacterized protein n=1 Tax=Morus notabilis TaxID=981085 RepID=W9S0K9_9ROSA|nr:hypothetical protein L484_006663 [Morus notabilis]
MDRYKFFDINITSLEGLKSRKNRFSPLESKFYAVASIATSTGAFASTQQTLLSTPLGNKNHVWNSISPMRFDAKESNLRCEYPLLVIQLRKTRALRDDKDVSEALIVPLIENSRIDKPGCSNSAVFRVVSHQKANSAKQAKLGFLYFSYEFSNRSNMAKQQVTNGSEGDVLVPPLPPAWDSESVRTYRDTNQKYYQLKDINNAVYQLLFFR